MAGRGFLGESAGLKHQGLGDALMSLSQKEKPVKLLGDGPKQ